MTIDPAKKKRLVQFLGMTDSSADGEALNAIRLANKLRKELNATWEELLGLSPVNPAEVRRQHDGFYRGDPMRGFSSRDDLDDLVRKMREAAARGGATRPSADDLRREQQYWKDAAAQSSRASADVREKDETVLARGRLDRLLERETLNPGKRDYFEAIRDKHKNTGHIGQAHRAAIEREYYKSGWDEPLGAAKRVSFTIGPCPLCRKHSTMSKKLPLNDEPTPVCDDCFDKFATTTERLEANEG